MVKMRMCKDCKYDIDIEGAIPGCEHRWHIFEAWFDGLDMCCDCGKDAEYLLK
jgi:hypothetical protein